MHRFVTQPVVLLITLSLLINITGCQTAVDNGLIPITTDADKARNLYLKGRDMQERLLDQQSRSILEECVNEDTAFALGYLALAFAQPTNKDSMTYLRKAVQYSDEASEGEKLLIMAYVASAEGDVLAQGRHLRKLVSTYPKDARAHDLLGNYYYKQQQYSQAITQYTKAIGLNPEFSAPYNNLGYSYRALGKYDEAAKTFRQYIEIIPNDPNPYDSYAELLMKMGKFEESIKNYRKALEVRPDFTYSHIGIATNLSFLGQEEEAHNELTELLAAAGDDGQRREAYTAIAMTHIYEGGYYQAIKTIEHQLAVAEKGQDLASIASDLNLLGEFYYEAGEYEKSSELFTDAYARVSQSKLPENLKQRSERILFYNEARIAIKQNSLELARQKSNAYGLAVVKTGNPVLIRQSHELMGSLAMAEKDYDAAVKEFELGNLENAYTLYHLALAYKGKNDMMKAFEFAEKAADFNELDDFNYAYVRTKAQLLSDRLSSRLHS